MNEVKMTGNLTRDAKLTQKGGYMLSLASGKGDNTVFILCFAPESYVNEHKDDFQKAVKGAYVELEGFLTQWKDENATHTGICCRNVVIHGKRESKAPY